MTERNSLSRRESLLGIGAAGTVLGGTALGISSVMAGDDDEKGKDNETDSEGKGDDSKTDQEKEEQKAKDEDEDDQEDTDGEKKGAFELALVCHRKGKATFRVHNDLSEAAKVSWSTDTAGQTDGDTDDNGDDGEADEDFDPDGETIEDGEEVDDDGDDNGDNGDTDTDNGDTDTNNGDTDTDDGYEDGDFSGKVTVPKKDSETFETDVVSKDTTVSLYYDGKKVATEDVDKDVCEKSTMADKIDLEVVCYRTRKGDDYDDNGDDGDTDDNGDDEGEADEDFDPDGETIEDGEEVDDDDDDDNGDNGDTDTDNGDVDNGDDDTKTREAKFRVHNGNKKEVKVNWMVNGDGQGGKLYLDGKESECFWVTAHDGPKTTVTITHEDKEVDTKKADADACSDDCDDT
ncbi:hypothetical protein OB955_18800 [Halobacteria archaeon AArc-m2/3/4]|uniref:Uncharacterized protein n=1 Tax=Natronoglomus mannanivorans TaxID=2979990 RepID=A0AAP3E3B0_9EURY|nr:hypothetical protein [Halobacteria archaeon AArc-xg1-1]MCU4974773.1 hypothetical protein [Halobacteria archaeon AArc-m2/3/4]